MTVYVCFDKDIECGDRPEGWCLGCPKRGLLRVAVAPYAAHTGPTAMRPATPEEHRWLHLALRRSGTLIAPGKLAPEATIRHLMQVAYRWADEPNHPDIGRTDTLEIELRKAFAAVMEGDGGLSDGVMAVPANCRQCGRQLRLDGLCVECDYSDGVPGTLKRAGEPPEQRYRERCADGLRCLNGCLSTEPCWHEQQQAKRTNGVQGTLNDREKDHG